MKYSAFLLLSIASALPMNVPVGHSTEIAESSLLPSTEKKLESWGVPRSPFKGFTTNPEVAKIQSPEALVNEQLIRQSIPPLPPANSKVLKMDNAEAAVNEGHDIKNEFNPIETPEQAIRLLQGKGLN